MWNFVIRLLIEGYLELIFSVYFNLKYSNCDFKFFGSWVNYFSAVIFAGILVIAPFFIAVFYYRNFHRFEDEEFTEKYGSVYEGLKINSRTVILFSIYFLIRRGLFMAVSILLYSKVILQLGAAIFITLMSGCYILHFKPFEDPLLNKLEAMNELVTLFLINVTYTFTDIFESARFKYNIGFVFVLGLATCISIHLFFLFKDMIRSFMLSFKAWKIRRDRKKKEVKPVKIDDSV